MKKKLLKHFFVVFALLFYTICVRANTIDSLYHLVMSTDKIDPKTVNRLFVALDADGITDSLITIRRTDRANAVRQSVCYSVGLYYNSLYQHLQAAEAFRSSAHYAQQNDDRRAEAEALSAASVQYHHLGNFEQAMLLCGQALHIDSIYNDAEALSCDFNILAGTSLSAGYSDDAVRYILKAIEAEKKRPEPTKLAIRYGTAAEIFNKKGKTDEALHYAMMAYELNRKEGNSIGVARRLSQMADIYVTRKDLTTAERYYRRAIDTLELYKEQHSLGIDYRLLGNILQLQNRHAEALSCYKNAEFIARKTGNRFFLSLVKRAMARSQISIGQQREAAQNLQLALELSDSLHSEKIEQMATNFRSQLEWQELQEITEKQRHLIGLQRIIIGFLGLLLLGALLTFLFSRRHKNNRTNIASTHQNSIVLAEEIVKETSEKPLISAADKQFLIKVSDFVHTNMKSRKITIELLAEEMCMSRNQFSRRLTAVSGETPNNYITRIKMEKAVRLLRDTNMSVKEVAYECGFDESNYFIHVFRQVYGSTPQQYRQTPGI